AWAVAGGALDSRRMRLRYPHRPPARQSLALRWQECPYRGRGEGIGGRARGRRLPGEGWDWHHHGGERKGGPATHRGENRSQGNFPGPDHLGVQESRGPAGAESLAALTGP